MKKKDLKGLRFLCYCIVCEFFEVKMDVDVDFCEWYCLMILMVVGKDNDLLMR